MSKKRIIIIYAASSDAVGRMGGYGERLPPGHILLYYAPIDIDNNVFSIDDDILFSDDDDSALHGALQMTAG